MDTVGTVIWVGIGSVIGVAIFLLMAWGEAVKIHNKDDR